MRGIYSLLFLGAIQHSLACTDPPKPVPAKDLDKIQPKEDGKAGATALAPIPAGPVAIVNGVEIPNEKFRAIYDLKLKKYADRGKEVPTSADRRYRKSIVERLIYHEVLKQEAAKLGVDYDPAALQEKEEQQKRGIRDWAKHLETRGETEESLRDMAVAELRERALLTKLDKLKVTPEEIEEDYQKIKSNWKSDKPRVRASHILIPIGPEKNGADPHAKGPGGSTPEPTAEQKAKWEAEALARAQEIYKEVTAPGADFAAIAEAKSTGPSAAKGGDISIFTADRMQAEFSDVAFKMKVGEISKPVKTNFGYHIIKLTGKWPAGDLPKEALEDQIIGRLEQRKLYQGRRELKEELLKAATIVDNIAPTLGPEPTPKGPGKRGGRMGPGGSRKEALERRRGGPGHEDAKPAAAAVVKDGHDGKADEDDKPADKEPEDAAEPE